MNASKSKNHFKWIFILAGFLCGIVLTAGGGLLVYRVTSGNKVLNKLPFILNKGKDHVISFSKKKIRKIVKPISKPQQGSNPGEIYLTINADTAIGKISPGIYGSNLSSKAEFEMDIAKLAKEFGITNFRFPGGSSLGYRWKTASYDFEDRFDNAPLSNMENVIKFSRIAGARLVIQVNVESGTAQEAAGWVRYMNKENGAGVTYWELGNEVYGDWDRAHMSGDEYVQVIKEYAALMKGVDPTIKIGADWGDIKFQEFNKAVAEGAFDDIDFVSYHWYPNHINNQHRYQDRNHPYPGELMANSLAVGKLVNRFNKMVDRYAPHRKGKIEFTVMEWDGSWDGVPSDLTFEYKGRMWSLANAIFYANALGEFAKHGVTVADQYTFQEVMFGFIRGWDVDAGWGGSHWDGKTIRPKGLAFKLLAKNFQGDLMESALTGSPVYFKEPDWRPDSYTGEVPYVQGFVSRSADQKSLTIVLTNQHAENDYKINIAVNGTPIPESRGEAWILNGPDLKAQNDGAPGKVSVKKYEISGVKNRFNYRIPARSVNVLKIFLN